MVDLLEHNKTESCEGPSTDIVVGVADSSMEELLNGRVAIGPAVCHGDGGHPTPPEDGISLLDEGANQCVSLLAFAVHDECDA